MDPAVKETMNVLKASLATKVHKLILVSSLTACFFNPDWPQDKIKDESCWSNKELCKENENWYPLAKTEAEEMALEFGERRTGCTSPHFAQVWFLALYYNMWRSIPPTRSFST